MTEAAGNPPSIPHLFLFVRPCISIPQVPKILRHKLHALLQALVPILTQFALCRQPLSRDFYIFRHIAHHIQPVCMLPLFSRNLLFRLQLLTEHAVFCREFFLCQVMLFLIQILLSACILICFPEQSFLLLANARYSFLAHLRYLLG